MPSANLEQLLMKVLSLIVGLAVILSSGSAIAITGEKYAHEAKITLDQARSTALKQRPGKITGQELEREHGGSGLRYSFDIAAHGRTFEVGIDAKTGKVLELKAEGPHSD
jgi:uncharacterized membrane protein YkoI